MLKKKNGKTCRFSLCETSIVRDDFLLLVNKTWKLVFSLVRRP